jgi:excisionase family DNA binding protein
MEQEILLSPIKLSELGELVETSVRKAFERSTFTKVDSKNEPDLVDIKEASKLLGLAIPTLYAKVSERRIPHSKQGKKLYFSRKQLEEWVKSGQRKTIVEIENEATRIVSGSKVKTL